jgi:hypothetical protein
VHVLFKNPAEIGNILIAELRGHTVDTAVPEKLRSPQTFPLMDIGGYIDIIF